MGHSGTSEHSFSWKNGPHFPPNFGLSRALRFLEVVPFPHFAEHLVHEVQGVILHGMGHSWVLQVLVMLRAPHREDTVDRTFLDIAGLLLLQSGTRRITPGLA